MKLGEEKKAQTSIEYLLILAAAVVLAVVVGLYLKSIPPRIHDEAGGKTENIINGF